MSQTHSHPEAVSLKDLVLSPLNVRKTPPGAAEQEELKASLSAHGLLENLVVRAADDGRFEVLAGGRRLAALQALAAEECIPADYPVRCLIHDGDPGEVSLAENVVRLSMHALDQFEAFAALADKGQSVAEIASRFGHSETLVRQRLRLGRVAPEIREAYRDDAITLEAMMAFAVTEDHGQQLSVWNEVKDGYIHASHVKRLLTDEKIAATSKLVRFIGLEAYQAAGGAITRDLFAEGDAGVWLEDRALVERLAQAKFEVAASDLKQAEGWKWVQAASDLPWDLIQKCQTVYPQAQEPTPEQAAELERLQKGLEIYEAIDADGGLSPEDEEKVAELEERYAEIEDALRAYADEDLARAGAFVSIDHSGELSIRRGLVRPEDRSAETATVGDGAARASDYSAKLAEDLGAFRLQIAQAHLAQDFDCAFDLALFTMAHGVLGVGYLSGKPLDASYTATLPHGFAERFGTEGAQLPPDFGLAWLDLSPEEGFQAMCAQPPEIKRRLFAHCVALTLRGGLGNVGGDDLHEEVGRRLGVDVAAHWRPTAENFFKRLKKDRALAIAEEVLGETWAHNHRDEKKAVLAETLEANFSGNRSPGVAAEQAAVAARWLPDGMAYPRGETPDAGEPVPGEPAPDDLPEAFRLPAAE